MINPERFFQFNEEKPFKMSPENQLQVSLKIASNLPYFEGHFKDNPVLPGVALLDLSLVLVNSIDSNAKKTFLTIKSAKFSEVIRPHDMLTILLKCDPGNQSYSLDFINQVSAPVCKLVFSVK